MKKIIFSVFLTLVVLTSSIYFLMPDKAKILIEDTRTKYFIQDDGWVLGATEYVNIYDGTKKMRASSREVTYWNDSENVYAKRTSTWKDGIITIQLYTFSQESGDIEQFPVKNEFQCLNCQGKIVHYEIRDIKYDGETKQIDSPFSFGYNMKIEWGDGAYYSKVFQQKSSDKIIIKYRPKDDDETYNVRLFDPPVQAKTLSSKYNVTFEFSKLGIIDKCLDIKIQNLQDSSDTLDLKTILNETNFDVGSTNLNFKQWTSEEVLVNDTETICSPHNETTVNGTIIEHQNCTTNIIGSHTEEKWSWKNKKLLTQDKEGEITLRNSWENVPIQKAGNKDTIQFQLCFSTPIEKTSNGWGSKGTFYLNLNGEIFYDKTHSSWFDESWNSTRQISNLTGNFSYMNISYSDITSAQTDFDDLRFTNTANDTELNFTISDKVDSSWVTVRVHNIDSEIQLWYDNADVTTTSSANDTYFSPIAMWYFDETSGTNAKDSIGTYNLTTVNTEDADWQGAGIKSGLDFDGVNEYAYHATFLDTMPANLSGAFWFKLENTHNSASSRARLVGKINDMEANSYDWFALTLMETTGKLRLGVIRDHNHVVLESTITSWTGGTWYHIAWKVGAGGMELWVNGVSEGTDASTQMPNDGTNDNFVIAVKQADASLIEYFNGIIDEMAFWGTDTAMTTDLAYKLYTQNEPNYVLGAEERLMSGTLKDGDGNAINGGSIFIVRQSDNTLIGNTTSNATGDWRYTIALGTYIVTGYDPTNTTLDGDAEPHVVVS